MLKIGYACINSSMKETFRTCRLKTWEEKGNAYIKELALHNFSHTLRIIRWNIEHDIFFYRLSSDIVPFASHPKQTWEWWKDTEIIHITSQIKELQKKHCIRLSCHPGQYNVLNSKNKNVVQTTIKELEYHEQLMTLVGGNDIILHIGGVYGNKEESIKRFATNYQNLSPNIKKRLRIENDDKSFSLIDVIRVHELTGAPICFDIHHHHCYHNEENLEEMLQIVWNSWEGFGVPKVHISSGKEHDLDRSHHEYIHERDFRSLLSYIGNKEIDIMVEAKGKELAVLAIKSFFH